MNRPPVKWTDAETEWIVQMWQDGNSARQCAEAFVLKFHRRITRNAVIGKVHRMGITHRGETPKRLKPRNSRSNLGFGYRSPIELPPKKSIRNSGDVKAALRRYRPGRGVYMEPPKAGYDFSIKGCTWDDLEFGDCRCRWPVESGPEHLHGHLFCGEGIVPGLSWCEEHAKRVFAGVAVPAKEKEEEHVLEPA